MKRLKLPLFNLFKKKFTCYNQLFPFLIVTVLHVFLKFFWNYFGEKGDFQHKCYTISKLLIKVYSFDISIYPLFLSTLRTLPVAYFTHLQWVYIFYVILSIFALKQYWLKSDVRDKTICIRKSTEKYKPYSAFIDFNKTKFL